MPRTLSEKSVDRWIELARIYCEVRAAVRVSQDDGRLTQQQRSELCRWLSTLEERISFPEGRHDSRRTQPAQAECSMRKAAR